MLLRRLTKHVESQNWLAVGIDFLIVVLGVFIGIQLGNWNDTRSDKREYDLAVERYVIEAKANLETLNNLDNEFSGTLVEVGQAIDALQTCQDTPENLQIVETGLSRAVGTSGLALQTSALEELNNSPSLLAQQSSAMRRLFSATKFRADIFLREVEYIETLPLQQPLQSSPLLRVGPLENRELVYNGVDYSRPERPLKLTVPISQACKDNQLVKALYTWERWQGALPAVASILRDDLEANIAALEN